MWYTLDRSNPAGTRRKSKISSVGIPLVFPQIADRRTEESASFPPDITPRDLVSFLVPPWDTEPFLAIPCFHLKVAESIRKQNAGP